MKKLVSILLTVVFVCMALASCTQQKQEGTYVIGICNYVDDASLNQIVDSIRAELKAVAGDKIVVKYDNCGADANILNQIINNFITEKVDLMVAVATPVAIAMQAATEDNGIPVIFAAVSDPVAAGLVETLEAPGSNLSGSSDYLDANGLLDLVFQAVPDATKIGLLYDVGQDSSKTSIDAAQKYLAAKGVQIISHTGSTVDEITLATNAMVADGVDAVFTPTDNTVMKSELAIYEILRDAGIPHFGGADAFALNGAFCGYGVDYVALGTVTGDMICRVLIDGEDISTMPVETLHGGTATVNTETCEAIGYNFEDIKAKFLTVAESVKEITTADSFD